MLKLSNIDTFYGPIQALRNVSLRVEEGEIVSLLGGNACGKSTTMKTILGLVKSRQGTIEFRGKRIDKLPPSAIVRAGISPVLEARRLFPYLTVYENLLMGAYTRRDREQIASDFERVYGYFPVLQERSRQWAGTLSGGEQQMLAIGRALMSEPELLLCDEISLGLAPVVIKSIYKQLEVISQEGLTIALVEQDVKRSLKFADYAYVMLEGKIALHGTADDLGEEQVKKAYFGM